MGTERLKAEAASWAQRHRHNQLWRERNRDKAREYMVAYSARKRNASQCDFTSGEWTILKDEFAGRCAYCGEIPARLSRDHVIPVSAGGAHTYTNIVPACQSCNSKKGARLLSEWADSHPELVRS